MRGPDKIYCPDKIKGAVFTAPQNHHFTVVIINLSELSPETV